MKASFDPRFSTSAWVGLELPDILMTLFDSSDLPVPPQVENMRIKCAVAGTDIAVTTQHLKPADGGVWLTGVLLPDDPSISVEPGSDLEFQFTVMVKSGSKFSALPAVEVVLKFMGGVPAVMTLVEHNLDLKVIPSSQIDGTVRVCDSRSRPFRGLEGQLTLRLSASGACDGGGPWEVHKGVFRLEGLTAKIDSGKAGAVTFQCNLLDSRQRAGAGRASRQIKGPVLKKDIKAANLCLIFHQEKGALGRGRNGEYVLEYKGRRFNDVVLQTVDDSGHQLDLSHLGLHTATLQQLSRHTENKSHDITITKGKSRPGSVSQYLDIRRTCQYRAKLGDLTADLLVVVNPGAPPMPQSRCSTCA